MILGAYINPLEVVFEGKSKENQVSIIESCEIEIFL